MESFALAQPFAGSDCVDRRYNRLNDDYERLHALCRFFLDSAGPELESGGRSMVPFLIDAAELYEEFVAAWLTRNARDEYAVGVQVPVNYDGTPDMNSKIDLTLTAKDSDQVLCVLDTKYKVSDDPEYGDMYQVTSYALTQGCHDAFLVYPEALRPAMDIRARPGRMIRSVTGRSGSDPSHSPCAMRATIRAPSWTPVERDFLVSFGQRWRQRPRRIRLLWRLRPDPSPTGSHPTRDRQAADKEMLRHHQIAALLRFRVGIGRGTYAYLSLIHI